MAGNNKRKVKVSVDADLMPIVEALNEFIEEKTALNKSASTIRNYQQSVEFFIDFHGFDDETPLSVVEPSHFFKWANTLKLDGVKPSSINHYLRDCRAFFYWCMDNAYIENRFQIKMIEVQEEAIKLYSEEEIDILLEKPHKPTKTNDYFVEWRTWAVVNWVLGTGNRAGTVVDVRIGDIDFSKKEVILRHTKNKKAQTIPLSSSLETAIKEYIRYFRRGVDDEAYLFPNVGEEKLTTNALRLAYTRYCKDRDISHYNIHGLRHSFAKMWIRNNGDTFRLQKLLGHSDLSMTRRYVKLFNEDLKDDFDKFNPLDSIKRKTSRRKAVKANADD